MHYYYFYYFERREECDARQMEAKDVTLTSNHFDEPNARLVGDRFRNLRLFAIYFFSVSFPNANAFCLMWEYIFRIPNTATNLIYDHRSNWVVFVLRRSTKIEWVARSVHKGLVARCAYARSPFFEKVQMGFWSSCLCIVEWHPNAKIANSHVNPYSF